ncbi:MAG: hypothetical protein ABEJ82_09970 [Haloplanus sp.]
MDHDLDIAEKRVFADREGATEVFVAGDRGVVAVAVSGDLVGEFSLDHQCVARDVAVAGDRRAVATDSDVLVGDYDPTAFGPARAVGFDGDDLLAAGDDGRVARLTGDGWDSVGTVADPRAIDAGMVAAGDGVYRVVGDGLVDVGLDDVADVSAHGLPLAATGHGLYRLGNGWMDELDGAFHAVSVDADDDRAHAAGDACYERERVGAWARVDLPVDDRVADVGYAGETTVAVTESGTVLLSAGEGWRTRELGVDGVRRVAVRSA